MACIAEGTFCSCKRVLYADSMEDMGKVDRAHQKPRLGVTYILSSFAREMPSRWAGVN